MKNSIDRTNSPRKRAGSRRNKKLKNVRTFRSDHICYPACGYYSHMVFLDESLRGPRARAFR